MLLALPLAILACATQPNFIYFNELEGGEASAPMPDGRAAFDSSTIDSTLGGDSAAPGDDSGDDGSPSDDGGPGNGSMDAAIDAPAEGGCGPLDTPSNCGACGVSCDMTYSNDASCTLTGTTGLCSYASCVSGFADCDASAPNTNGCDTPITTLNNCGACGVSCNTAYSVDASCGPTGCTYSCAPGFSDCDAAPPNVNGCATPITTVTNCGACGVSCNTANSVDAGCGPTGCTYACAPNYANCNTTAAPSNAGGCACNTPACCASTGATPGGGGPGYVCETTHSNGAGQSFYSCEPTGTYSSASATAACQAYVETLGLSGTVCVAPDCSNGTYTADYDAIYYYNATTKVGYVWVYEGTPEYYPLDLPATTTGAVYTAATFCTTTRAAGGLGTWN
jgi:hypothetical protein